METLALVPELDIHGNVGNVCLPAESQREMPTLSVVGRKGPLILVRHAARMKTATFLAGAFVFAMLSGCERRASPLDEDQSPILYSGQLSVVREEGRNTTVRYSHGVMLRTSTTWADGSVQHRIIDGDRGRIYWWSENRRDLGVGLREARRTAPMTHWGFQPTAQRGGPCSEAGETGRVWRIHRPQNFKQDERISEACVSDDGVVLSEQHDRTPGAPTHLAWRATRVVRGPIPPAVFSPPDWPHHSER